MMVVPYRAEHLLGLQIQMGQKGVAPFITEEYAKSLEGGIAFSAMVDDECIAVGGVAKIWENRGIVWSILGEKAGPHLVSIHRLAKMVLKDVPFKRIEADTPCEFVQGHRWLRMLGFKMEAKCMKAFRPGGGDSALYAKVNHG